MPLFTDLALVLPDGGHNGFHLLQELALRRRPAQRIGELVVDRREQRQLLAQEHFRVRERVVQQVIAVEFCLLFVDCSIAKEKEC